MATKKTETKAEPKGDKLSEYVESKISDYMALHNATHTQVVELALRDFFYDLESGQRPRSSSYLEPALP